MQWQLQDAKARFSEVVRRAIEEGPQTVTRHGEDAVVIVSAAKFRSLSARRGGLKALLAAAPLDGIEVVRGKDRGRDVDF